MSRVSVVQIICLALLLPLREVSFSIAHNESVFAMAGYSVFRHADTEVDYCFIVEDTFCRLIINVKPEL